MTWQYLPLDKAVSNKAILLVPRPGKHAPGARPEYDPDVEKIDGRDYVKIKFQFPPKISSDGRKTIWEEASERPDNESVFAFKFSGSRDITMNFTYIVDSFDTDNRDAWTIQRITHYIRSVRGYSIVGRKMGKNDGYADTNLVAQLRIWAIGGSHTQTIRFKNVDIKHGETLIVPKDPNLAYPLRSDVTIDIGLWTPGVNEAGSEEPLARVRGLRVLEPVWY